MTRHELIRYWQFNVTTGCYLISRTLPNKCPLDLSVGGLSYLAYARRFCNTIASFKATTQRRYRENMLQRVQRIDISSLSITRIQIEWGRPPTHRPDHQPLNPASSGTVFMVILLTDKTEHLNHGADDFDTESASNFGSDPQAHHA